jgi:broad specificity phosphatase PhoE
VGESEAAVATRIEGLLQSLYAAAADGDAFVGHSHVFRRLCSTVGGPRLDGPLKRTHRRPTALLESPPSRRVASPRRESAVADPQSSPASGPRRGSRTRGR